MKIKTKHFNKEQIQILKEEVDNGIHRMLELIETQISEKRYDRAYFLIEKVTKSIKLSERLGGNV